MSEGLIGSGLAALTFSIDGADQETYEKIRVGGHYDEVVKRVSDFCERNKREGSPVKVQVDCIESTLTGEQKVEFRRFWQRLAKVTFIPLSDWSGQMKLPAEFGEPVGLPHRAHRYPCDLLWSIVTVAANGQGMYCCHDYKLSSNMPRVQDVGLRGVWTAQGEERARQVSGAYGSICRGCPEWQRRSEHIGGLKNQMVHLGSALRRALT
jgi:hypothetical protein